MPDFYDHPDGTCTEVPDSYYEHPDYYQLDESDYPDSYDADDNEPDEPLDDEEPDEYLPIEPAYEHSAALNLLRAMMKFTK